MMNRYDELSPLQQALFDSLINAVASAPDVAIADIDQRLAGTLKGVRTITGKALNQ